MMLNTKHAGCVGILLVDRNVTEQEEVEANRFEDAAILRCTMCRAKVVDDTTSSRPDRYRKTRVPDQGVFEVNSAAGAYGWK